MNKFWITAFFSLLAVTGVHAAEETASSKAAYYNTQMSISVGRVIASPEAVAEFGKEVEITVSDKGNTHGWHVRFSVEQPFVTKDGVTAVHAKAQLFDVAGSVQTLAAEPELLLQLGERGELTFPLAGAGKRTGILSMTVRSSLLQI